MKIEDVIKRTAAIQQLIQTLHTELAGLLYEARLYKADKGVKTVLIRTGSGEEFDDLADIIEYIAGGLSDVAINIQIKE